MPAFMSSAHGLHRLGALAVACTIAVGVGACGSSDDSASTSDKSPAQTTAATPPSEEQRITQTVEGLYEDLAASDAARVCSAMSAEASAQIAQQVPGGSTEAPKDRTCETSMSAFMRAAAQSGVLRQTIGAKVEDVSIAGRNATVTVSFGAGSGKVALRKEGGEWRFRPGAVGPSS